MCIRFKNIYGTAALGQANVSKKFNVLKERMR